MEKEIEVDKNKIDDVEGLRDECVNKLGGEFEELENKLVCTLEEEK